MHLFGNSTFVLVAADLSELIWKVVLYIDFVHILPGMNVYQHDLECEETLSD